MLARIIKVNNINKYIRSCSSTTYTKEQQTEIINNNKKIVDEKMEELLSQKSVKKIINGITSVTSINHLYKYYTFIGPVQYHAHKSVSKYIETMPNSIFLAISIVKPEYVSHRIKNENDVNILNEYYLNNPYLILDTDNKHYKYIIDNIITKYKSDKKVMKHILLNMRTDTEDYDILIRKIIKIFNDDNIFDISKI